MVRRVKNGWMGTGVRSIYRAEKFLILRARYQLLAQSQGFAIPPAIAEIFARVPAQADGVTGDDYLVHVKEAITWPDVDVLEEAIIGVLPASDLPEQLNLQRLVYSQTVTPAEYASYQKTMLDLSGVAPPPGQAVADRMRSELLAVTQRIKYMLELAPPKERARGALTSRTLIFMAVCIVVIFGLYVLSETVAPRYNDTFVPTEALFAVLFAGLVGGFISVEQRLQTPTEVDPLYKWLELDASGFSMLLSPFIGMIFAVVLFVIIIGGFVTGPFFPTFLTCGEMDAGAAAAKHCKAHDFASFAYASTPDSPASWAKLVVWSFAAGFLERLVPDILTRIAAVAEKS